MLTGLAISYTIGSVLGVYTLSAATITPTYSTVALGASTVVTLIRTITTPTTTSGNPGYHLGKAVTVTSTLSAIGDPATGTCYVTGAAAGTTTLLFGESATYRCESPTSCALAYYIDSLLTSTITIQQYASQSTTTVAVTGTSPNTNCNYEGYTLELVYSYNGWELDPQYYVVGAKLIPSFNPDVQVAPATKYLTVSWVYVDPKTITTPPSNNFYQFFSNLWTPLKQRFGIA